MPFARASSLDRLLACSGGSFLGGTDVKSERAEEAADWGTLVHHWKATGEIKQVNEWKNHPALFKRKLEKSGVKREDWWPVEDFFHEKAFALDPDGGVVAYDGERAEAWKAERDDRFCTGTCDGFGWMFDTLWVDDLKTGRFVSLEEYKQQLRFYALCVVRLTAYRGDVNLTLTHWPRYPNHGQPVRMGMVIEQDDLKAFAKQLSRLRSEILRGRDKPELVTLNPSESACLWCPSRGVCPAYERSGN